VPELSMVPELEMPVPPLMDTVRVPELSMVPELEMPTPPPET